MTMLQYNVQTPISEDVRYTASSPCTSNMAVTSARSVPSPESEPRVVIQCVLFSHIESEGRRFALRRALMPCLKREGSLWSCELDDLRVMGYGPSREQSLGRFMDDFAATYDGLVDEADDHLTADSRQLRDALRALVVQVTPAVAGDAWRVFGIHTTTILVGTAL